MVSSLIVSGTFPVDFFFDEDDLLAGPDLRSLVRFLAVVFFVDSVTEGDVPSPPSIVGV